MCILFIYTSTKDTDGDYSLILASNRDEYYDRPALPMAPWEEDPDVFGGRDVQAGGTWLALSPLRRKLGVLLNVPGSNTENAKSRGKFVTDFVKCEKNTEDYLASMDSYIKDCNGFVLATVQFEDSTPVVKAYCNVENSLIRYKEGCQGFGNSQPIKPLTKVEAGKEKFEQICNRFNKIDQKDNLVEALLSLLKSDERYLPDAQLEERQPQLYKEFSSIFVQIPNVRYGTRTHTLLLVTKTGKLDAIEVNLVAPIDPMKPKWEVRKYEFDLCTGAKGKLVSRDVL